MCRSLLKLFKLASAKPAHSASPVSSHRNHMSSSASSLTLVLPCVTARGMPCLLFLEICEYQNFFLQDNHFHGCVSYHA